MARRVYVKESAIAQFSKKCGASSEMKNTVFSSIRALGEKPEELGYEIPFVKPPFYQMVVGEYRIHYVFDADELTVLYMGILGVC